MTTSNTARRKRRRAQRGRTGAVMVEAVIVISALAAFFAWALYMHRLASAKIDSLYTARREVWAAALAGCGADGGFDLKSLVTSFSGNDDTDAMGWLPIGKRVSRDVTRQVTASSPLTASATLSSTAVFPCTIVPPKSDPIGDPTGWVFDLFM